MMCDTYILRLRIEVVRAFQVFHSSSDVAQELECILSTHQAIVDELLNGFGDAFFISGPEDILRHVISRILAVQVSEDVGGRQCDLLGLMR